MTLSVMTISMTILIKMSLSIMPLIIMTFNVIKLIIIMFGITTFSKKGLFTKLGINET